MREPDMFISTSSTDKAVVEYLNKLFYECGQKQVSDVHIEDEEDNTRVRLRVSNDLVELEDRISHEVSRTLQERIRARCKWPLSDTRQCLDGRLRLRFDYGSLDVRVSLVPTIFGHSIVCRILDQRNSGRYIADIEMSDQVRETIHAIINEPSGIFLVTGPTGSGKTTTLYAILNELNDLSRNIITIEDPVEYVKRGLNQINVDKAVSFPQALRSALRQDPDIILVGEIRDAETALIATQAALTGHLVLSTLHANDAPSSITRMMDLGVDGYTLGTALRGVLAQRLVRRVMPEAPLAMPTPHEEKWLKLHGLPIKPYASPESQAHFQGRIPLMEILTVDPEMRKGILEASVTTIQRAAKRQRQYQTLSAAGASLIEAGKTTIGEILRATSNMDLLDRSARLGERLLSKGLITEEQLDTALNHQRGNNDAQLLGELLISAGAINAQDLQQTIFS